MFVPHFFYFFFSRKVPLNYFDSFSVLQVITVDVRNHGESPHSPVMNYEVMAEDIEALLVDLNIRRAIVLGHSMGGKIAMTLALTKVCGIIVYYNEKYNI